MLAGEIVRFSFPYVFAHVRCAHRPAPHGLALYAKPLTTQHRRYSHSPTQRCSNRNAQILVNLVTGIAIPLAFEEQLNLGTALINIHHNAVAVAVAFAVAVAVVATAVLALGDRPRSIDLCGLAALNTTFTV